MASQIVGREHWGHTHQWSAIGAGVSLFGVGVIKGIDYVKHSISHTHGDYGLNFSDGSAELSIIAGILIAYTLFHAGAGLENRSIGRNIEEITTEPVRRKKRPNIQ